MKVDVEPSWAGIEIDNTLTSRGAESLSNIQMPVNHDTCEAVSEPSKRATYLAL
jgi:hypothetical protein